MESHKRLADVVEFIKTYADQYDFEWSMIAAQGYQESQLIQSKRSPAGAIGIMQIMPATALDPAVNIPDIHLAGPNIHAGVKRSEEHTSELQSLMRISYAVFCLKKK